MNRRIEPIEVSGQYRKSMRAHGNAGGRRTKDATEDKIIIRYERDKVDGDGNERKPGET